MAADKRTRAELLAALADAKNEASVAVENATDRLGEQVKTLKARLDRQTPEARAIDMCVTALDALKQVDADRRGSNRGYSTSTYTNVQVYGYPEVQPSDAIGQVLSYLQVKYGIPDRSGEVDHLLNQVDRLCAENSALREQLQQVGRLVSEARP